MSPKEKTTEISQDDMNTPTVNIPLTPTRASGVPAIFSHQYQNDHNNSYTSSIHSPKISLSQLRLNELSKTQLPSGSSLSQRNVEQINNYDMKELRSGFFDPFYIPPSKFCLTDLDLELETKNKPKTIKAKRMKEYVMAHVDSIKLLLLGNYRLLMKVIIAYTVAMVLALDNRTSGWLGSEVILLPLVTLLYHPGRSLGVQLEITAQSTVGSAFALGWASLAYIIDDATKPARNRPGGILACSLILGCFFISFIRAKFLRLYYFNLSYGIGLIYLSTNYNKINPHDVSPIHWKNCWNFSMPYLFGNLLCLIVSAVVFPHVRYREATMVLIDTIKDIKNMFEICTNGSNETPNELKEKINNRTVLLSDYFREYSNEFTVSPFQLEDLKNVRNNLQLSMGPLRALPSPGVLFSGDDLEKMQQGKEGTVSPLCQSPLDPLSEAQTPLPREADFDHKYGSNSKLVYTSVMKDYFKEPSISLVKVMIKFLEIAEEFLLVHGRIDHSMKDKKEELGFKLKQSKFGLESAIRNLDIRYRKFTKTEYFSKGLLNDQDVISIFLYLKYSRQVASWFLSIERALETIAEHSRLFHINAPDYPFARSLQRLSRMSLHDQGNTTVFLYLDISHEIDEIFEKIYNANTSRLQEKVRLKNVESSGVETEEKSDMAKKEKKSKRALDHNDFDFHNTKNPFRYRLYLLTKNMYGYEVRYAFKTTIAVVLLALPGFLTDSSTWYQKHDCWWGPVILFILMNPKLRGNARDLGRRIVLCVLGIFWAWCANQSYHFQNGYIVFLFSMIWSVPLFIRYTMMPHAKSGLLGLMSYNIVVLSIYSRSAHSTISVWKTCWILGLSILIGFGTSIIINWFLWPFMTTNEVRKSFSALLSHISQSYQFITDRYLYRDLNDDPTQLTLQLANIREVRMIRSIYSVREMLKLTKTEFSLLESFNSELYGELLNSCDTIFSKIIEARMSGVYYHVWENDGEEAITQELLPLRRDSVATVIFIFYILSNSFRSRNKIPKYLPSAIHSRKMLFDKMAELQMRRYKKHGATGHTLSNNNDLTTLDAILNNNSAKVTINHGVEKTHWSEIHGIAFSRTYTEITEEIERVIEFAKLILGEEDV